MSQVKNVTEKVGEKTEAIQLNNMVNNTTTDSNVEVKVIKNNTSWFEANYENILQHIFKFDD